MLLAEIHLCRRVGRFWWLLGRRRVAAGGGGPCRWQRVARVGGGDAGGAGGRHRPRIAARRSGSRGGACGGRGEGAHVDGSMAFLGGVVHKGEEKGGGGGRRRKEFLGFLCLCRGAGGKVDKYLTAFPLSRNR